MYSEPRGGIELKENVTLRSDDMMLSTVKALNSGHHWFSEKVSAIESCPL